MRGEHHKCGTASIPLNYGVDIMFSPIRATSAGRFSTGPAAVPSNGCVHTLK